MYQNYLRYFEFCNFDTKFSIRDREKTINFDGNLKIFQISMLTGTAKPGFLQFVIRKHVIFGVSCGNSDGKQAGMQRPNSSISVFLSRARRNESARYANVTNYWQRRITRRFLSPPWLQSSRQLAAVPPATATLVDGFQDTLPLFHRLLYPISYPSLVTICCDQITNTS